LGISIAYPSKNAWVKELGIANIKLLADFWHMEKGQKTKKITLFFCMKACYYITYW